MATSASVEELWLGARGVARYVTFLDRSQYWERSRLLEYQYRKLSTLLVEAQTHVPYYRDLFARIGFDARRDFQSLDDLARIPVLDKPTARRAGALLLHRRHAKRAAIRSTSGSTGEPFHVHVSPAQRAIERATALRAWHWAGYRLGGRIAVVRSYVPKAGQPFWRLNRFENTLYFSAYHLTLEHAANYLAELRRFRPSILRGYASSLYILARMAEEAGVEVPTVKGVIAGSETLLPAYRDCIERVFGARVFDWYGQAESTVTMSECSAHAGLHINDEYGLCELLPGSHLAPDERRIVATNLDNLAMPLIRYETGDIASVGEGGTCACGRTLPRVRGIQGRSDDLIRTPSGRVVPSVNFYAVFHEFSQVRGFQLVQQSLDAVDVRIQSSGLDQSSKIRLLRDLEDRIGSDVRFDLLENVGFEQSPDGKKRVVVSRI